MIHRDAPDQECKCHFSLNVNRRLCTRFRQGRAVLTTLRADYRPEHLVQGGRTRAGFGGSGRPTLRFPREQKPRSLFSVSHLVTPATTSASNQHRLTPTCVGGFARVFRRGTCLKSPGPSRNNGSRAVIGRRSPGAEGPPQNGGEGRAGEGRGRWLPTAWRPAST